MFIMFALRPLAIILPGNLQTLACQKGCPPCKVVPHVTSDLSVFDFFVVVCILNTLNNIEAIINCVQL